MMLLQARNIEGGCGLGGSFGEMFCKTFEYFMCVVFGKVFATFSLLNCNKISLKPAFIFDKFILVFTVWYE